MNVHFFDRVALLLRMLFVVPFEDFVSENGGFTDLLLSFSFSYLVSYTFSTFFLVVDVVVAFVHHLFRPLGKKDLIFFFFYVRLSSFSFFFVC